MRPASRWYGVILILVSICVPLAVFAQQATEVIRDIVVRGNQRVETATVESYLTVRRGDRFDPAELDRSLRNLFATGLFDDVRLSRDGDRLVVEVAENPIVNRVAFEGNRRITDQELEAEVQIRPRTVFTRARVQSAVERILELYRRSGRYAARVEPKVIELDQNRVDLVFEISEGPLTEVCGIAFLGNEHFSDATLRGVIQTTEAAWYRFLTTDDTYDPDRVEVDKELLRKFYRARGYAEAEVISAVAKLSPDGRCFYLTFSLEEGPLYRFGRIALASNLRDLSTDELERLVGTREGAIFDADAIEATVQALTEEVGKLGYAFAQITPDIALRTEEGVADVTYRIEEGPRVYVERIDIKGNVRTLDRVIRREFRLAEGDAFNTALLRRSVQRVRNLGYFEKVDVRTRQGSASDRIIVELEVAERSTGELSFGAGFSTSDGPLADIRLSERNLLGRGQSVSASLTVSGRRQEIDLSFTEPWFLDRELAAGFDLFRRRTDLQNEASFDQDRTGGRLRLGYPLTEFVRHTVRYTLQDTEINDVDPSASRFIRAEEGNRLTSAFGHTLAWDRRDTRFLPSEGFLVRLDQDLAGFGGDNCYLRNEGRLEFYYPFRPDVVLGLFATGGWIFGLGGEDVHLSDRFFIGGSTLRGFRYGGIGPRDTTTDDALGGNVYYVGTAELRFPLGLPEELRMFGRVFGDVGTLTDLDVEGPEIKDSGNLRAGVGVGFSWLSPIGPLSIDITEAVLKDDEDQTERFRLSFGTRF